MGKNDIQGIGDARLDLAGRYSGNINTLGADYFKFHIDRIPKFVQFVQSVTVPALNIGQINQPTRYIPIVHPGDSVEFGTIDVVFMLDEDMESYLEIYKWMSTTKAFDRPDLVAENSEYFSDATLFVLNSAKRPNLQIKFEKVFPSTLGGWEFSSTNTTKEPIPVTVTFYFTKFTVEKI